MTPLECAMAALEETPAEALDRAKAEALMRGYDARWREAGYVCEGKEVQFCHELQNPATGRKSRRWRMAGKYDASLLTADLTATRLLEAQR